MTPYSYYFDQNFTELKHNDASSSILLGAINPILTRPQTSQVLDCTQKSFVIELKIQIVRHQSIVSYLQVTKAVSDQRDIYIHIPSEQLLTAECSESGHTQWNILLQIIHMPYPCHHTSWLRGQPTNMVYNNLHLIHYCLCNNCII